MIDQGRIVAADRTWRVIQRRQQILPDIPDPGCVLLHTFKNKLDVRIIQFQKLGLYHLRRFIISADPNDRLCGANRIQHDIEDILDRS